MRRSALCCQTELQRKERKQRQVSIHHKKWRNPYSTLARRRRACLLAKWHGWESSLAFTSGSGLFTGNCLLGCGFAHKKVKLGGVLRNWSVVYDANLVGSLFLVWVIASQSGLLDGPVGGTALKMAYGKVASVQQGLIATCSEASVVTGSFVWLFTYRLRPGPSSGRSERFSSRSWRLFPAASSTALPTCISFQRPA